MDHSLQSNGSYSSRLALRILEIRSLLICVTKYSSYSTLKAEAMDPSLLRILFLQQLLSNVSMILALTTKGGNMQELDEMADSAKEGILPSIVMVATPQASGV